jgi:voltage-gated potassium channel Kch
MTPRQRWLLLGALWITLFVLGSIGFRMQADAAGIGRSNLDVAYLIFQLITLQYNGADSVLNWQLEIARFLAPALAFSTVLQSGSLVFADELRRFRLRYVRDHTVICGLDDVGSRLAQAFLDRGDTVVALELDPAAAGVASARAAGASVLIGDATDPGLLRAARVGAARQLVAVCGNDALNVQVASQAATVIGDRDGMAVRCAVHLNDAELAALLRTVDLDRRGGLRMSFFNTHERAARAVLAENRPFAAGDGTDHHIAVFGLGQFGRNVVISLAQQWADLDPHHPLRLTLVDTVARGRWRALTLQHPALETACDASTVDFDLIAPTDESIAEIQRLFAADPPTWICIAHADESLSLSTAFFIYRSLGVRSVPLVVRTRTAAGLGALLISGAGSTTDLPTMHAFAFLDRTCTVAAVTDSLREQLAQAVHEDYMLHAPAASTFVRPWHELDDDERELSRRRVDGILADLDSIGCDIGPLRRWGAAQTSFTGDEVTSLARREHARWMADRLAAGWTHAERRDDAAKTNPLLVQWDDLPEQVRIANIESARALPGLLARAGFEPIRLR